MFILWAFAEIKPCIHSSGKLIVKFYNHIFWRVDAISVKLKVETSENLIIYIYIYYKNSYHYNITYFLFILRHKEMCQIYLQFLRLFVFCLQTNIWKSLHIALVAKYNWHHHPYVYKFCSYGWTQETHQAKWLQLQHLTNTLPLWLNRTDISIYKHCL